MTRPNDLPEYSDPPVDEVVIGLQFEPIEGFTDIHIGLFWQRVRKEYPTPVQRPRAETPIEDLSAQASEPRMPKVELQLGPPTSHNDRTWMISADDSCLLQVQDNQFLRNWRRRASPYPSLEPLKREFWATFEKFTDLLVEEDFGEPSIRQLEVTYFNWISGTDSSQFFIPAQASVLNIEGLHAAPETLIHLASYIDLDSDGRPVGRLRVDCQPAFRHGEGEPQHGTRLALSYKAPLSSSDREGVNERLDRGRRLIDLSFEALTTPSAQEKWGRRSEV